ncbi:ATP-binding protein [Streptomyces sp. NPDC020875]|uniref:ATP-binding protein n=1 Tax=Streptomyces sp. NPDC020875 TaxID=3154898 RepID=UPI0033E8939D
MGTNGSTMLEPLRQGPPPVDPASALGSAACSLSARYEAVRGARGFTRATLKDWDLYDHFDDIALVVSELVTNALRHALPDEPARESFLPPVRLHLMRWPGRLVVAVRDPSAEGPGTGAVARRNPARTPSALGAPRHGVSPLNAVDALDRTGSREPLDAVEGFEGKGFEGKGFDGERFEAGAFGTDGFEADGFETEGFEQSFPDPDGTAESGRGLFLVDAYADSWGWHPLAGALHGKVVWALFRLA